MGKDKLKREDDRHDPDRAEKIIMLASSIVTVVVLGYMVWKALVLPAEPILEAQVLAIQPAPDGDGAIVEVGLRNDGGAGLRLAEVEVDCDTPAPSVTFHNVPADARFTGKVRCPAGTTSANATVVSWIPA